MKQFLKNSSRSLAVVLLAGLVLAGCWGGGSKKKQPDTSASAEPDKVLYERALGDIKKGHHIVGRLTLQTLINTYPDSEYLAKAKLAVADSYYKEGGTANLAQSIAEYKDFITFFPFLKEAALAQKQIGMAHFRRMEKPDRDRTEGRLAEDEFQIFLEKYPTDELAPEVEQRLREVQEVLAEGDFRIARFYYIKGSPRAAAVRLTQLTNRYPLYSQADRANWMLARVWEKSEKTDIASQYYARIVRDYPLSDLAPYAKAQLTRLGVPVPQPNAEALARMQRERDAQRDRAGFLRRSWGMMRSAPDISMAAQGGKPTLSPEGETNTETLTPGGTSTVGTGGTGAGQNASVAIVTPGSGGITKSTGSASSQPGGQPGAGSADPLKSDASAPDPKASGSAEKSDDKSKKEDDKKKESSSKKKKGLRKLIPW